MISMILQDNFENKKRDYGKTISGDFNLNNYIYLSSKFNLDDLYKYGFGWCDNYTHECGAYELFAEDENGDSIRVYYIPNREELSIEVMSSSICCSSSCNLVTTFLISLIKIGMLTFEEDIKINIVTQ